MQTIQKAFAFIAAVFFSVQGVAAGVTVITHGFQFANSYPDWVDDMGAAVASRAGTGTTVIHMEVDRNSSGFGELAVTRFEAEGKLPGEEGWSGEVVVKLFWNKVAGVTDPFNTLDIAQTVVPFLVAPVQIGPTEIPPLSRLSFHFIGHSRGASVVCEMAAQLANEDIWIDHVTLLDPHPAITDPIVATDLPLIIPDNVTFVDNYYQEEQYPTGQSVLGSAEVKLDYRGAFNHSEIHQWYLGTIVAELIPAAPMYWYTTTDLGYSLSAVAQGRKFRKDLAAAYGGDGLRWNGAPRTEVTKDPDAMWPNAELPPFLEPFFFNGQIKEVPGRYSGNGRVLKAFGLDADKNPFNKNSIFLLGTGGRATEGQIEETRWSAIFSRDYDGRHLVFFITETDELGQTDGSEPCRYYYLDQEFLTEDLRFLEQTLTEEGMIVSVNGNGVSSIAIESSDNLRSWQPIGTTTNSLLVEVPVGVEKLFLRGTME